MKPTVHEAGMTLTLGPIVRNNCFCLFFPRHRACQIHAKMVVDVFRFMTRRITNAHVPKSILLGKTAKIVSNKVVTVHTNIRWSDLVRLDLEMRRYSLLNWISTSSWSRRFRTCSVVFDHVRPPDDNRRVAWISSMNRLISELQLSRIPSSSQIAS